MPLKNKAQFRALMAKNPAVAKEFYNATPDFQSLPVGPTRKAIKKHLRRNSAVPSSANG